MYNNPNVDFVNIVHIKNLVKLRPVILIILKGNEILALINGQWYKCEKMISNNSNEDLVNMKAYIKFGEILSICSQDIERKRIFGVN